jgi:hypothetical protein
MNLAKIGNATREPGRPRLSPSSKPTQTATASDGVYPMNQPSRNPFVVPDLAATIPENP